MSSIRRVFALLASLVVLGAVGRAEAQLPTTTSVAVSTTNPVTRAPALSGFRTSDQINYADCTGDATMTFNLVLSANHSMYGLEVWAGSGCDILTNRQTTSLTTCWKLFASSPTTTTPSVTLNIRDILYGATVLHANGTSDTTDDAGVVTSGGSPGSGGADGGISGSSTVSSTGGSTTTTTEPIIPTGTIVRGTDVNSCTDTSGLPVITPLNVYFLLVDGSANAASSTFYTTHYKLLAPDPPVNISADIGDGLLPIHFSYANNQAADTTINGYQFYCDPPPGLAAAEDAGVAPTDAGAAIPVCTPSTVLMPGFRAGDQYRCGTASLSATAGNATGLVNGVAYNVAVAATDTYQNTGNISALTCNVPQPITGFFKAYRGAGGQGGGGFCSFSLKPEPVPLLALLGLASCLVLRRRRAT
jgi:hypothetical protein